MANEVIYWSPGSYASPVTPVAGTFTATLAGQTTSAIAFDADASTIQATLEALSSIGSGNVDVSDAGSFNMRVEFIGDLADVNVGPLTINSSVKQAANTVTVTEIQSGSTGVEQNIVEISLDDAPTEGHFILTESGIGDTAPIAYNASAAGVESAIDALVAYDVTGSPGGPWTCTSDAQEFYSWSGRDDDGTPSPLRKALPYEVVVDQEGSGFAGSGGVTLPTAALAGTGSSNYTGSGGVTLPAATLAGAGIVPYIGTGGVSLPAATLAGTGEATIPVEGSGGVTMPAALLAGAGYVPFEGTGGVELPAALLAGDGYTRMDIEGSGGVAMTAAMLSGDGGLQYTGTGGVTLTAATLAGRGRKRYGDTGLPFKHIEHRTAGI